MGKNFRGNKIERETKWSPTTTKKEETIMMTREESIMKTTGSIYVVTYSNYLKNFDENFGNLEKAIDCADKIYNNCRHELTDLCILEYDFTFGRIDVVKDYLA